VQMKMANSEEESIASVQLDFNSAEKFDLNFIAKSGQLQRPWIIHRAPLGSHERFVALLLEYYQGQLPAWLSPVQVYLLPVSEDQIPYAKQLEKKLLAANVRVQVDLNQGSLSKRILFAHRLRPFSKIVIGVREVESNILEVQLRDEKYSIPEADILNTLKPLIFLAKEDQ